MYLIGGEDVAVRGNVEATYLDMLTLHFLLLAYLRSILKWHFDCYRNAKIAEIPRALLLNSYQGPALHPEEALECPPRLPAV